MTVNLRTYVYDYYEYGPGWDTDLLLQTRHTKFLIAPRLNQVPMSMCLKSPVLV